jgi:hypothetical protein
MKHLCDKQQTHHCHIFKSKSHIKYLVFTAYTQRIYTIKKTLNQILKISEKKKYKNFILLQLNYEDKEPCLAAIVVHHSSMYITHKSGFLV